MAAKPPAAAPTPDDDEDETAGVAPGGDDTGDDDSTDSGSEDEGSEGQPRVLLTVMCNPDGSYTVIKGDEDDSDEGEGGSDEGAEGDESDQSESGSDEDEGSGEEGGAAEGAESEGSQGETYHSVGEALKAILDIFREDEASQQGGSGDDFSAGYKGEAPEGAGGESEAPATVKY